MEDAGSGSGGSGSVRGSHGQRGRLPLVLQFFQYDRDRAIVETLREEHAGNGFMHGAGSISDSLLP